MSFAIWKEKPPFVFDPEDREQIYKVGDKWVVTDDPTKATQEAVDAVLNAPKPDAEPSIADIVAVLAPEQKSALDAKLAAKVKP